MTAVTAFELWTGAKSERQSAAVEHLLAAMVPVPPEMEAARWGAALRRVLLSRGEDIGMADSLITGIWLHVGGMLLTLNRRHFERIDGLKLSVAHGEEP